MYFIYTYILIRIHSILELFILHALIYTYTFIRLFHIFNMDNTLSLAILESQFDFFTTYNFGSSSFSSYYSSINDFLSEFDEPCSFLQSTQLQQVIFIDFRLRYLYEVKWSMRRSISSNNSFNLIKLIQELSDMSIEFSSQLEKMDCLVGSNYHTLFNDAYYAKIYFTRCMDYSQADQLTNFHHYMIKIDIDRHTLKKMRLDSVILIYYLLS